MTSSSHSKTQPNLPLATTSCTHKMHSLVNFSDNAKTFVQPGPDRIGAKYMKALYREYEDETFTTPKVRRCMHVMHAALLALPSPDP
jgi:hypothetical protein